MYNGIGLASVRGSGTSGYVQTNKFNLRPGAYQRRMEGGEGKGPEQRQPNKDILEHNRKREVELQVEILRAQLEDDGVDEEEIEERLADHRTKLLEKAAAAAAAAERNAQQRQETHAVAQRKQDQMDRLRSAFGLRESKEGEAFDRELQERKRQEKIAERDARENERRKAAERAEEERRRAEKRRRREAKEAEKEQKRAARKAAKEAERVAKEAEETRKSEELRWKSEGYYSKAVPDTGRYNGEASPGSRDHSPLADDGPEHSPQPRPAKRRHVPRSQSSSPAPEAPPPLPLDTDGAADTEALPALPPESPGRKLLNTTLPTAVTAEGQLKEPVETTTREA